MSLSDFNVLVFIIEILIVVKLVIHKPNDNYWKSMVLIHCCKHLFIHYLKSDSFDHLRVIIICVIALFEVGNLSNFLSMLSGSIATK